jgi:uncharacterized SAM-binding protein YcdF (DUF218 family)
MPCGLRRILFSSFLVIVTISLLIKLSAPILGGFLIINKPLPHADALVVMAGSTQERLPAAASLFQDGIAQTILLTNDGVLGAWSEEKQRNLYHVEWAEYDLIKMQVPEKAIVKLAYSSSGSIYDALNSRTEIFDKGIKSIIIVTSDYHTRRSLWCFERVLRGHPIKIGVCSAKSEVSKMSDIKRFEELCREMIKYIYYTYKYSRLE